MAFQYLYCRNPVLNLSHLLIESSQERDKVKTRVQSPTSLAPRFMILRSKFSHHSLPLSSLFSLTSSLTSSWDQSIHLWSDCSPINIYCSTLSRHYKNYHHNGSPMTRRRGTEIEKRVISCYVTSFTCWYQKTDLLTPIG